MRAVHVYIGDIVLARLSLSCVYRYICIPFLLRGALSVLAAAHWCVYVYLYVGTSGCVRDAI